MYWYTELFSGLGSLKAIIYNNDNNNNFVVELQLITIVVAILKLTK